MAEFLVELYVSRSDLDAVERGTERARRATEELTREGTRVQYLRSIFLPEDETCFYLFDADKVEHVEEAARRASLSFARIAQAVTAPRGVREA